MATADFVPGPNALFNPWQANLINVIDNYKSTWDFPAGAAAEETALKVKQTRYEAAWAIVATGEFTDAQLVELNDARHDYESGDPENPLDTSIRIFIGSHIRKNRNVTKAQKEELGITIPDTVPTPISDSNARISGVEVAGTVKEMKHLIHTSSVTVPGQESKAMGEGVQEIEVFMVLTDASVKEAPAYKDFEYVGQVKRGLYTHTFAPEKEGMRAWYYARKVIKGKTKTFGPPSIPWNAIVA